MNGVFKKLKINEDLSIEMSDEPFRDPNYAFKTIEKVIYPCEIYDAIVISSELCSIGGRNHYISTLKAIRMENVTSLQEYQEDGNGVFIKDVKNKLPDPYNDKLNPFTAAVVLACLNKAKDIALTTEQHQKKMTIQRQIRTLINSDDDISLKKAEELLSYHGLSIADILKDEFVVSTK